MQSVTLPSGLQSITFGDEFNQTMESATLPIDLQSIASAAGLSIALRTQCGPYKKGEGGKPGDKFKFRLCRIPKVCLERL